jgi:hypothetical protein
MDIHKNARLTPFGRERLVKMVLGGQTPQAAARKAAERGRLAIEGEPPHSVSLIHGRGDQ